jgi:hypothetical protein
VRWGWSDSLQGSGAIRSRGHGLEISDALRSESNPFTAAAIRAITDGSGKETTIFAMINYTGGWNGGLFTYNGNELADGESFFVGRP